MRSSFWIKREILIVRERVAATPDQAGELRRITGGRRRGVKGLAGLRSVSVLSGKGGVGKSNVAVNLAMSLALSGKKVVLLDADLGMANVDLLCGVTSKYNLAHLVRGERKIEEILIPLENGVLLLPGGAGMQALTELDDEDQSILIDKLSVVERYADILLIDAGAGIHKNTMSFGTAADLTLLVTTPEPTSIRDVYGVLKTLAISTGSRIDVALVVNMAASHSEGKEIAERIQMAANQFLSLPVAYGGAVLTDEKVRKAVRMRTPFSLAFPDCQASKDISAIAARVMMNGAEPQEGRGAKSFFLRLAKNLGLGG